MLRIISLLLFCFANLAQAFEQPIQVLTERLSPYQVFNQNGELVGVNTAKVREIFSRAGLAYQIHVNEWSVSYRQTRQEKNVCIYSLAETAERKPLFAWIAPLNKVTAYFYSLKAKNINLERFEDSFQYRLAAIAEDVSFHHLVSRGFSVGENLYEVKNHQALLDMLNHRSQIIDLVMLNDILLADRLKNRAFRHLYKKHNNFVAFESDIYLACNPHSDRSLLNKLKQAAKSIR